VRIKSVKSRTRARSLEREAAMLQRWFHAK
jgi:hypothetical protein